MKAFYLYRICVTGATSWSYIEPNYIDEAERKSKYFMSHVHVPDTPLYIDSALYGKIESKFDYNTTLVSGLVRYGTTSDNSNVFKLKWMEDYYLLDINGYDAIQIFGKQTVVFVQNNSVIARMGPVKYILVDKEPLCYAGAFFIEDDKQKNVAK